MSQAPSPEHPVSLSKRLAGALREITQPFIDLARAPRALWGVNLSYLLEGMVYFGIVGYLAMFTRQYIGLSDVWGGWTVGLMTGGITLSMFFLGGLADRWGVRKALIIAFIVLIAGRMFIAGAGSSAVNGEVILRPAGSDDGTSHQTMEVSFSKPVDVTTGTLQLEDADGNVLTARWSPGVPEGGADPATADMPNEAWWTTLSEELDPNREYVVRIEGVEAMTTLSRLGLALGLVQQGEVEMTPVFTEGVERRIQLGELLASQGDAKKMHTGLDDPVSVSLVNGLFSPMFWAVIMGVLLVTIGYGMYQPAAYTAVRQFTNPKTAGMAFAMLYAVMNLGGWLPSFFGPIRRSVGISGAIWVYVFFTGLALLVTVVLLSRKTVRRAIERAQEETEALKKAAATATGASEGEIKGEVAADGEDVGAQAEAASTETPAKAEPAGVEAGQRKGFGKAILSWFTNHPLADPKFSFFIFCLIPVQTLFAHNWLTIPLYVERAYRGMWIGQNFEVAVNFNPLLIFILAPLVAAMTTKAKVYKQMIVGTFVMAAPTFILAIGPSFWTLLCYLVLMTVGEAIWQPRFLQYAAEIAPEGRTGAYMGVAQFPWFLTKIITSIYSGWFLERYCPAHGELNTEAMWFIYGLIAISSTIMLLMARNWIGKDFKTKADA